LSFDIEIFERDGCVPFVLVLRLRLGYGNEARDQAKRYGPEMVQK
jgi:hypothetical protein